MNERPSTQMPREGSAANPPDAARILVVEDFEPLRVLMVRVLTLEGYEVAGVGTASRALALSTSEHFDLLIADHDVPGGDGTDIARQSVAHNPRIGVLFVSGNAEASLDLEVPGTSPGFLQKPFDIDELALRVRQVLTAPPV
ncbi:MAG TPA: response regulator [Nocardioidaceae bacterium]|nr:response regulator [Nocardioidaceae bacterium]